MDRVQLFEAFEDAFNPSVDLWPLDKGECDRDASDRRLESGDSLVSHHVNAKLSDKGVSSGSVAVEEHRGYSGRFEISGGSDRNKVSWGNGWGVWVSVRVVWPFWPARPAWAV